MCDSRTELKACLLSLLMDCLRRLQAQWFRQHEQSTIEQVKGQLWSHWLPKCIEVFRRLPPVPINNDVKAYYRYWAVLMTELQWA